MSSKKISTREVIVKRAVEMFSEHGVEAIPLYKVAADLGISPGNLTYYFPNKTALLRELVARLDQDLAALIEGQNDPTDPDNVAGLLTDIFRLMWSNRYFFSATLAIAQIESDFTKDYFRVRSKVRTLTKQVLQKTIDDGHMRAVRAPNTIDLLADNLWSVWVDCINTVQLEEMGGTVSDNRAIYVCAVHHVSVLEPYCSAAFARRMFMNLEGLVGSMSAGDVQSD